MFARLCTVLCAYHSLLSGKMLTPIEPCFSLTVHPRWWVHSCSKSERRHESAFAGVLQWQTFLDLEVRTPCFRLKAYEAYRTRTASGFGGRNPMIFGEAWHFDKLNIGSQTTNSIVPFGALFFKPKAERSFALNPKTAWFWQVSHVATAVLESALRGLQQALKKYTDTVATPKSWQSPPTLNRIWKAPNGAVERPLQKWVKTACLLSHLLQQLHKMHSNSSCTCLPYLSILVLTRLDNYLIPGSCRQKFEESKSLTRILTRIGCKHCKVSCFSVTSSRESQSGTMILDDTHISHISHTSSFIFWFQMIWEFRRAKECIRSGNTGAEEEAEGATSKCTSVWIKHATAEIASEAKDITEQDPTIHVWYMLLSMITCFKQYWIQFSDVLCLCDLEKYIAFSFGLMESIVSRQSRG